MIPAIPKLTILLGTASLLALAAAIALHDRAYAGEAQIAQAPSEEIPETVVITGSLTNGSGFVARDTLLIQ